MNHPIAPDDHGDDRSRAERVDHERVIEQGHASPRVPVGVERRRLGRSDDDQPPVGRSQDLDPGAVERAQRLGRDDVVRRARPPPCLRRRRRPDRGTGGSGSRRARPSRRSRPVPDRCAARARPRRPGSRGRGCRAVRPAGGAPDGAPMPGRPRAAAARRPTARRSAGSRTASPRRGPRPRRPLRVSASRGAPSRGTPHRLPSRPRRTTSIAADPHRSGRSRHAGGRSRCAGEPLLLERRARSPSHSRAAGDRGSTFNNVDLPAPFGPRIAENVPGPMARSTPLHSRRSPNRTEAPRVWMTSAEVDASKLASRRVCFIGRSPRAGRLRALGAERTCQAWNVAPAGKSVSVIVVIGMFAARRLVDLTLDVRGRVLAVVDEHLDLMRGDLVIDRRLVGRRRLRTLR